MDIFYFTSGVCMIVYNVAEVIEEKNVRLLKRRIRC